MESTQSRKPWNFGLGNGRTDNTYHPQIRLRPGKWVNEHKIIAEQVLGKSLPKGAEVHHWGNRIDNSKLVICQDKAYHRLLHTRQESLKATGLSNCRRCVYCKKWSDPKIDLDLTITNRANRANGIGVGKAQHKKCHASAEKLRRSNQKEISWPKDQS